MPRRTSTIAPSWSPRWGPGSRRATRSSTSPAATAGSGSTCARAGSRTRASTRNRRWSRRERAAGFTEKKLVFDLNPRQFRVADVTAELEAAGFRRVALRPFFVPQTRRLPAPATGALKALERTGPVARLALRARFTYLVAAVR